MANPHKLSYGCTPTSKELNYLFQICVWKKASTVTYLSPGQKVLNLKKNTKKKTNKGHKSYSQSLESERQ